MPKTEVSIEALLVWTYRQQSADHWWTSHQGLMPGEALVQFGQPQSPLVASGSVIREADDQSAPARMLVPWEIDGDAKLLHELVLALPSSAQRTAVVMAGRRGRRPDLLPAPRFSAVAELHEASPEEAANWQAYMRGPRRDHPWRSQAAASEARRLAVRPGTLLAPTVSHPRSKRPSICDLRLDPDPREWLAAQAAYATWHEALTALAWFLRQSGRLVGHALRPDLPPAPPAVPAFVAYHVARATDALPEGQPLPPRGYVPADLDWERVGLRRRKPRAVSTQNVVDGAAAA